MSDMRNRLGTATRAYRELSDAFPKHDLLRFASLDEEEGLRFNDEFFEKYTSKNGTPKYFDDNAIRTISAPARYSADLIKAKKEIRD